MRERWDWERWGERERERERGGVCSISQLTKVKDKGCRDGGGSGVIEMTDEVKWNEKEKTKKK